MNDAATAAALLHHQLEMQVQRPVPPGTQLSLPNKPATPLVNPPQPLTKDAQQDADNVDAQGVDASTTASYGAAADAVWQRFSDVDTVTDTEPNNELGSFYQVMGVVCLHNSQPTTDGIIAFFVSWIARYDLRSSGS